MAIRKTPLKTSSENGLVPALSKILEAHTLNSCHGMAFGASLRQDNLDG